MDRDRNITMHPQETTNPDTYFAPTNPQNTLHIDWDFFIPGWTMFEDSSQSNMDVELDILSSENFPLPSFDNLPSTNTWPNTVPWYQRNSVNDSFPSNNFDQLMISSPESIVPSPNSSLHWSDPTLSTFSTPTTSPQSISSQINIMPQRRLSPPQIASHTCESCGKSFPKRCFLTQHKKQHSKPITCPIPNCLHRTAKNREMDRHVAAQHSRDGPRSLCPVRGCKRARSGFARKDHLTRHLKNFHPEWHQ